MPVMLCMREPRNFCSSRDIVTTPLRTLDKARLEKRCGAKCQGIHALVWSDRWGRARVICTPQTVPPLELELAELYPRREYADDEQRDPAIALWDTPADLNEELPERQPGSLLGERLQRVAAARPHISLIQLLARQQAEAGVLPTAAAIPRCTAESCDREVRAKGLCSYHYQHQWDHLPPLLLPPERQCTAPGCDGVVAARQLCQRHYDANKTRGENVALSDKAREARDLADATGDPGDVGLAEALEAAERAEAQHMLATLQPEPDLTGIQLSEN